MTMRVMRALTVWLIVAAVLVASGCSRQATPEGSGGAGASPTKTRRLRGTPENSGSPSPEMAKSPTPGSAQQEELPTATASVPSVAETPDGSAREQLAQVTAIEISTTESLPVTVGVTLQGSFPDDCTRLSSIRQAKDGRTIRLVVLSERIPGRDCSQVEVPFEETVDLDLTGVTEGGYDLDVNGVTAALEITTEMLPLAESWATCPEIREGLLGYLNDTDGYCFLYPEAFRADSSSRGTVAVMGPEPTGEEGSVRAGLTIRNEGAADGRTVGEVADDYLLALEAEGKVIERGVVSLGTKEAVEVLVKPGPTLVRQVFVLHEGTVLVLTVGPVDAELPQAQEAEELWSAVASSLTFIEPQPLEANEEEYSYEGWVSHDLEDLGVRLSAPSGWVLASGAARYGLAPRGSEDPYLLSLAVDEDVPQEAILSMDALVDWIAQRDRGEGGGAFTARTRKCGGLDAVEFTGLVGVCHDVHVPVDGRVIRIALAPGGCDSEGAVAVAEYDAILAAVEFYEPS